MWVLRVAVPPPLPRGSPQPSAGRGLPALQTKQDVGELKWPVGLFCMKLHHRGDVRASWFRFNMHSADSSTKLLKSNWSP